MSVMAQAKLKAGVIYGDSLNQEYVYMPGSEIGVEDPLCVFERPGSRQDISVTEALVLIRRLSLKPAKHPRLGTSSC